MTALLWALLGASAAIAVEAYFQSHASLSYWQVWPVAVAVKLASR